MDKKSFLRMQLIMQDTEARSFNANLRRMVALTIFLKGRRLQLDEIRCEIEKQYDLRFTVGEIKNAIKSKNSGIIEEIDFHKIDRHGESFDTKEYYYKIDDKTSRKFHNIEKESENDKVIARFVIYAKDIGYEINKNDFKELINKFLYYIFNSNKTTLLLFLNAKKDEYKVKNIELTENEKLYINLFLNWDDKEKDSYIYRTVSYCVDYCLLTVKKGGDVYRNVFSGKKFYLDTNVILRLAGINNEERKAVTSAFIDKCKENGIQILYTNYTYNEIDETVKYNLNAINELLNGHRMVSKDNIAFYSKHTTNLDFINLYDEWVKNNASKYNDFNAFYIDIMNEIKGILSGFTREDGFSSEKVNKDEYDLLVNSLLSYKSSKYAKAYEKSVKIDIENYLYIKSKREKGRLDSLYDIKEYLISTDGNFCEWGKEVYDAIIPIVVLPSVWYSLLLKLSGRSDNDYKSFNLFLNQRYKMELDDMEDKKEDILRIIQQMDESVEIKDLILDDIKKRIDGKQPAEVNVNKIVDEAKESVIEKRAEELFSKKENYIKVDTELKSITSTIDKIAENRAIKKVSRIKKIKNIIPWIKIFCGMGLLILILYMYNRYSGFFNMMKGMLNEWYNIFSFGVMFVGVLFIEPLITLIENKCTFEYFKGRELKRLTKDYENK